MATINRYEALSEKKQMKEFFSLFISRLEDPRVQGRCNHPLLEILVIGFCAILCGAESFVEMERFGRAKEAWFRRYLKLSQGIPSHDTFRRVLSLLNPEQVEIAFFEWAKEISSQSYHRTKRLCMDGKSLKGTERSFNQGKRPLHLVNAYYPDSGLVLGQKQSKSSGFSEIEAIESLLELLEVRGTLISVDAASSYPKLLQKIKSKKGHYLVPIKKNQKYVYPSLKGIFNKIPKSGKHFKVFDQAETTERNRGRLEKRSCTVVLLSTLEEKVRSKIQKHEPHIQTLLRISRYRAEKDRRYFVRAKNKNSGRYYDKNSRYFNPRGRIKKEVVYYVSDLKLGASRALEQIRQHWSIENKLHWCLDVSFGEDQWRVQDRRSARNLSVLRKMAHNILKQEPTSVGIKSKIKKAGWDETYLEALIFDQKTQLDRNFKVCA